ncbi:oxygen-independent coproporphyrinogen III oxidase [Rariglobus hedericola]|uniref:Coproporphyrinogen-III oxidase n=1 Tax=Rariglobus hedericola TaxID=2597822 RepID=A0A556QS22_9BACT|nr:oxygen-independent coproporphyrinogen III oxidase [Rariglobus hedericola]TSJ79423.1 oxygen-independent coproporphyrinogen III oxidase [Rariglobus hedericola]
MVSSLLTDAFSVTPAAADFDLLRKYSGPVPRYTSYPTANLFTTDRAVFDPVDLIACDNQLGAGPLSLYVHLPFCASRCWFCGCTNLVTTRQSAADDYLDDLEREIALTAPLIDPARRVTQLHLGGGTPTFLSAEQLRRLGRIFRDAFKFNDTAEIAVEIDPRHLDLDQIDALRDLGARRASLGVQDTDPAVQTAIHRVQPQVLNERAVTLLRHAGFNSINIDLIYGLPKQTVSTFARTIDDVLGLVPERLSVFSYAHVPGLKPAQRIFDQQGQLPGVDEKLRMQLLAKERLLAAGYVEIGIDHYARPRDELAVAVRDHTLHRNFQGYSTRAGASVYGFGISAISTTPDGYRQNHKSLATYRMALLKGELPVARGWCLSDEDRRRQMLIMRLMCDHRLDFYALSRELGVDVSIRYAPELASLADLEADGIVVRDEHGVYITEAGLPFVRVVASRFDAYLKRGAVVHARAV